MLYKFLRACFRLLFILVYRVEIHGKENMPTTGAVILAANHMSNLDPPLIAAFLSRPVSYMAKEELFHVPVIGFILRHCYSFSVRRGAADRGAIRAALKALKEGYCMGMFPEGTRARKGKRLKAQPGIALLAAMSGAPVIPATIEGTDGALKFHKFRVTYGAPLRFEGNRANKEALDAFAQKIMDVIYAQKRAA